MCGGPSQQQKEIQTAQVNFLNTMTEAYKTEFPQNQAILGQLTQAFEPILAAGPNQQGFSAAENTALNTQAMDTVGQNYTNLEQRLANNEAASGGGNEFLPSGANTQLQAELGTSAANQLATEQNNILTQNYSTGRQNFLTAANELGGTAAAYNPLGYASATTNAGNAAENTANQINQESNAWMGALGGALGGAVSGLTGGL